MPLSVRAIKGEISKYLSEKGRTSTKEDIDKIYPDVLSKMKDLKSDETRASVREALAHILMARERAAEKKFGK